MKRREKRQPESENQWVSTMCELLKGGVAAGLAAILTLLLCAVMVSAGLLREQWMDGAVLACCVAGAWLGGLLAVGRIGRRTLLVGLAVGGILFLLLLTAGLLAFEVGFDQARSVSALMWDSGFDCIRTVQDYGGNDRVVMGRKTAK